MNVLVLGGAGLLGQDLCAALASRGYPAHSVDREEVDITEAGAVAEAIANTGATQVVNCAAYTAVDQAESERDEAFRINVEGARLAAAQAAAARSTSSFLDRNLERQKGFVTPLLQLRSDRELALVCRRSR